MTDPSWTDTARAKRASTVAITRYKRMKENTQDTRPAQWHIPFPEHRTVADWF